jgi:hypothetical protein
MSQQDARERKGDKTEKDIFSQFLKTGTTKPVGEATATEISVYLWYTISCVASSIRALMAGISIKAADEAWM